jgi:LPXTG-site transpeptidase (sortase) family protein
MDGEGIPYVPLNGQDVAWYNFSTKPGAGSNAVFAGHINWERAPGVFSELVDVQPGDTVRLLSDDGREYTYEVFANFAVDPLDPASLKVMDPTSEDTVTLITCGGSWIPDASERFGGNYTDRTIVQARLTESVLAEPAAFSDGGG